MCLSSAGGAPEKYLTKFSWQIEAKCILDDVLMVCKGGVKEPRKSHCQVVLSQIEKKKALHKKKSDLAIDDFSCFRIFNLHSSHFGYWKRWACKMLTLPELWETIAVENKHWEKFRGSTLRAKPSGTDRAPEATVVHYSTQGGRVRI